MNFQVTNLKHSDRIQAVPMPVAVPMMDDILADRAGLAPEVERSSQSSDDAGMFRRAWPYAAIAVGGVATIVWDGYILWHVVRVSLSLFGFEI
jgi:hypothetical protein